MTLSNVIGKFFYAVIGVFVLLPATFITPAWAAETAPKIIDVHFHAHPQFRKRGRVVFDTYAAARNALELMDKYGISRAVIMPPPFTKGKDSAYDYRELSEIMAVQPDRFIYLAGGGSLNPMIHSVKPSSVNREHRKRFEQEARAILAAGAHGFGEMTALHLSMRPGHPFEEAPPDHPLFLLLADIAGDSGVPIDLHMEAVERILSTPRQASQRGGDNPDTLKANIAAFERLLSHNRKTPILWSHVGWDNTKQRRPALMRRLLKEHTNLYMSFKLRRRRSPQSDEGPLTANGELKADWLALLKEFPGRFLIGSDSHVYVKEHKSRFKVDLLVLLLKKLPADIARKVAGENAKHLFRLP
jgi:predicted TIM-barrel fold metal-dependent hydrolase